MIDELADILTYRSALIDAGFTEKQAAVQSEKLASIIDSNLATKKDMELLRKDLQMQTYLLTIRLGSMTVVMGGMLASFIKYLSNP